MPETANLSLEQLQALFDSRCKYRIAIILARSSGSRCLPSGVEELKPLDRGKIIDNRYLVALLFPTVQSIAHFGTVALLFPTVSYTHTIGTVIPESFADARHHTFANPLADHTAPTDNNNGNDNITTADYQRRDDGGDDSSPVSLNRGRPPSSDSRPGSLPPEVEMTNSDLTRLLPRDAAVGTRATRRGGLRL
eukprot:1194723-Prorocentrum_minimum.AAC.3